MIKIPLEQNRPTKFIFTPDCHFGWEKAHVGGKMVVKPTHNLQAIRAVLHFAQDFKPDVWILGGDNVNCGPVSRWHNGKPRLSEGFRLKQEYNLIDKELLYFIDYLIPSWGTKVWHRGNHENWIDEIVNTQPGLEGLIEAEEYLNLEQRSYKIADYGEISSLGKLNFVHGDVCLRNGNAAHPAKLLVNSYQRNIRCGHLHQLDAATKKAAIDAKDYHTGIVVPCLSTVDPEYRRNGPSQFINGFNYGYVLPDGNFTDYVVIITKGKCVINNVLYDGNKK